MSSVLILCPTFDHVDTLFVSIASVRAQSYDDWKVVVIGYGAPDRTGEIVAHIAREDPRVRYQWFPKSERFGENHRHQAILDSDSEFICHLSDDDIWLPDHLENMTGMLASAQWATQAPLRVQPDGTADWWPIHHGTAAIRHGVKDRKPPSAGINYVAYRRQAYLELPTGWTCAPWSEGTSDVYMWAKFFANPNLVVASSAKTSAIKFPSTAHGRKGRSPERRMAEITPWLARCAKPQFGRDLQKKASVLERLLQLFGRHDVGNAASVENALAICGITPVHEESAMNIAINDDRMMLPMTDAQLDEARLAWEIYRDLQSGADPAVSRTERGPQDWSNILRTVRQFASSKVATAANEVLSTTTAGD